MTRKILLLIFISLMITSCANRIYEENLYTMKNVAVISFTEDKFIGLEKSEDGIVGSSTYKTDIADWEMNQFAHGYTKYLIDKEGKYKIKDVKYNKEEFRQKYLFSDPEHLKHFASNSIFYNNTNNVADIYELRKANSTMEKIAGIRKHLIFLAYENDIDGFIIIAPGEDVNNTKPKLVGSYGLMEEKFFASNNIEPFASPEIIMYDVRTDHIIGQQLTKVIAPDADPVYYDKVGESFRWKRSFDDYSAIEQIKIENSIKDNLQYHIYRSLKSIGLIEYKPLKIIPAIY